MKSLITLAALFALAAPAAAQDAVSAAAAELVGRVTGLEQRVAALEQRAGIAADPSGKRDYASAYNLALATGKPLVCWSGSAICAACVDSTEGEWVNFVGDAPGCPTNAITIAVPEGTELVKAEAVTSWVTGSPTLGHVPSIRRSLQRFRNRRPLFGGGGMSQAAYQPATFAGMGHGGMTGVSAGGCATCGTSGGGFFRRR